MGKPSKVWFAGHWMNKLKCLQTLKTCEVAQKRDFNNFCFSTFLDWLCSVWKQCSTSIPDPYSG